MGGVVLAVASSGVGALFVLQLLNRNDRAQARSKAEARNKTAGENEKGKGKEGQEGATLTETQASDELTTRLLAPRKLLAPR